MTSTTPNLEILIQYYESFHLGLDSTNSPFCTLPTELVQMIVEKSDLISRINLRQVSFLLRTVVNQTQLPIEAAIITYGNGHLSIEFRPPSNDDEGCPVEKWESITLKDFSYVLKLPKFELEWIRITNRSCDGCEQREEGRCEECIIHGRRVRDLFGSDNKTRVEDLELELCLEEMLSIIPKFEPSALEYFAMGLLYKEIDEELGVSPEVLTNGSA